MNATDKTFLEGQITALLENDLGSIEREHLEELLRGDWECRRYWLEAMDLHAALLQDGGLSSGKFAVCAPVVRKKNAFSPRIIFAAAAAIALSATAAFLAGNHAKSDRSVASNAGQPKEEQTGSGCAVITQIHGNPGQAAGTILKPGILKTNGGLMRIEFFSGAYLLVEGKAELEIVSAWAAECLSGKVRASVPPAAEGFQLNAPGMDLVDIGTEFGVSVDADGTAQVHVFEGEVQAYPEGSPSELITGGQSLSKSTGVAAIRGQATPEDFMSANEMSVMMNSQAEIRMTQWKHSADTMSHDSDLLAYYEFTKPAGDRWIRTLENSAASTNSAFSGAAVGARWTEGRWPGKDALEFKGPADRVRIDFGSQTYSALTMVCWVRVDGLDRRYNGLFLTDGYDAGEPHWQIYEDGRLMFSLKYPMPGHPDRNHNQVYFSPSVFNLTNQRKWHQIAVTYENVSGEVVQYLDGREISRGVSRFHQAGRTISIGTAEIGNWGLPSEGHRWPIRNLNGRIDEFAIYSRALSPSEILKFYEAGTPE